MKKNSKIFTKNQFSSKKKNKEEIDEFFDLDDSNVNPRYNSQIFTNVPHSGGDNAEFEQGIPTITDKLSLYANPRNWWQLYLRGYPIIRTSINEDEDLKNIIKELLSKRDDNKELVPKEIDSVENIINQIDKLKDEDIQRIKDKLFKK